MSDMAERLADRVLQSLRGSGFGDEVERSVLERMYGHVDVPMGGEKNDRKKGTSLFQNVLELLPRHARHAYVQNQTARLSEVILLQKLFGTSVGRDVMAVDFEQKALTVQKADVVVDDSHQILSLHPVPQKRP